VSETFLVTLAAKDHFIRWSSAFQVWLSWEREEAQWPPLLEKVTVPIVGFNAIANIGYIIQMTFRNPRVVATGSSVQKHKKGF
jgi:hypothetical protein